MRVLNFMGLASKLCDLVYKCVSNSWYTILLMGEKIGFFKSTRGLHQGDPLFPALFIITFSLYLKHMVNSGYIRPYVATNSSLKITHQLCVDDMLILTNGSKVSLDRLCAALRRFVHVSRPRKYRNRTLFRCGKHRDSVKPQIIQVWANFEKREMPSTYLGALVFMEKPTQKFLSL